MPHKSAENFILLTLSLAESADKGALDEVDTMLEIRDSLIEKLAQSAPDLSASDWQAIENADRTLLHSLFRARESVGAELRLLNQRRIAVKAYHR